MEEHPTDLCTRHQISTVSTFAHTGPQIDSEPLTLYKKFNNATEKRFPLESEMDTENWVNQNTESCLKQNNTDLTI